MYISSQASGGKLVIARDEFGHELKMDARPPHGNDAGFQPVPLLLAALAGCLSMDIRMILEKMHIEAGEVRLEVEAEMDRSVTPAVFKQIHVTVETSETVSADKLAKAISLAETGYCNVAAMLKKVCPMDWSLKNLAD